MGLFDRFKKQKDTNVDNDAIHSGTESTNSDDVLDSSSITSTSTDTDSKESKITETESVLSGDKVHPNSVTETTIENISDTIDQNTTSDHIFDSVNSSAKNVTTSTANDVTPKQQQHNDLSFNEDSNHNGVDTSDKRDIHTNDHAVNKTKSKIINTPHTVADDTQSGSITSLKTDELDDIVKRIKSVKEEYGLSVKDLMDTKRNLNEKHAELESLQSRINKLCADIDKNQKIYSEITKTVEQKKSDLEKIKNNIKDSTDTHAKLLEDISKAQHTLSVTKTEQSETAQLLDDTNARLYNANQELRMQDEFQADTLTDTEREFIESSTHSKPLVQPPSTSTDSVNNDVQPSYAGVVEAASVVVASLKSRLNTTQKELEAVQSMLSQERQQHEATKKRLESMLSGENTDT